MKPNFWTKFFWILAAEEPQILQKCESFIQSYFIRIGRIVLINFIICFVSATYAFSQIFDNSIFDILLGLFFATTITIIYLLLLFTLSKNVLPHSEETSTEKLISIIVRIWPILLFSILISKPLEVMIFSSKINPILDEYKNELIVKNAENCKNVSDQIEYQNLIEQSTFFIKRIELINHHFPITWIVTLIILGLFLSPAILKRMHDRVDRYFVLKRNVFVQLIKDEYQLFENQYIKIISTNSKYNISIKIKNWIIANFDQKILKTTEEKLKEKLRFRLLEKKKFENRYLDSPFNTQPIVKEKVSLKNEDFITEFYNL